MAIQKISPDITEVFTLETHPAKAFSSSSLSGVTGSIKVFPRGSEIEKEILPIGSISSSQFTDANLNEYIKNVKRNQQYSSDISNFVSSYMSAVNQQGYSLRKQHRVEVTRVEPSFNLSSNTLMKSTIINTLMPFYRSIFPTAHFNYTNYHSLNFFTASNLPENTAILYPNSSSVSKPLGSYAPTGSFSFDFWINPKYKGEQGAAFKAGTLLHLSSCYAVSLVTGSSKDINGYTDGFRILLQLSHSAELSPSSLNPSSTGSFPRDLVFYSSDNSLQRNNWHHVTIRWGTTTINAGTGSIVIDDEVDTEFVIPSASAMPPGSNFGVVRDYPTVLFVGNFYQGTNAGTNAQALFFSEGIATKDGIQNLYPSDNSWGPNPVSYSLAHPLNAEVHDIKLYGKYLIDSEIQTFRSGGPTTLSDDLLLYIPPFFTRESPSRAFVADLNAGGVLKTPFFEEDGTTIHPFNTDFSYGVGGHYINLENFVKDFATGKFPRLFNLTASAITDQQQTPQTANEYLYNTGSNVKRAFTVLPCDNGLFYPNFNLLKLGSPLENVASGTVTITGSTDKFRNDLGNYDYSAISLKNLASTSSYRTGLLYATGSIVDDIVGARPENLNAEPGEVLTILQRTRDNTSNQVCFFDISNIFYGNNIKERSFAITDTEITGTSGKVSITLKDDGRGNVYRGDCLTTQATWNSVGNIFYNEGIVMVKSPHLFFFGKDKFDLTFKGVQNIHVLSFGLKAKGSLITSSSNPTYLPISASNLANDINQKFVYIDEILLHDESLNVIAKTKLAQPIIKRTEDSILFSTKIDY